MEEEYNNDENFCEHSTVSIHVMLTFVICSFELIKFKRRITIRLRAVESWDTATGKVLLRG